MCASLDRRFRRSASRDLTTPPSTANGSALNANARSYTPDLNFRRTKNSTGTAIYSRKVPKIRPASPEAPTSALFSSGARYRPAMISAADTLLFVARSTAPAM